MVVIYDKIRTMKIINKLQSKPVTIAFLGDSVTNGCFECFINDEGNIDTVYDVERSYAQVTKEHLLKLYPNADITIVNSGISGDNIVNGLSRFDKDILSYNPDLVVISYGLNDSLLNILPQYKETLEKMIQILQEKDIEVLFLTQNAMCTKVSDNIKEPKLRELAALCADIQNSGKLTRYYDAAKEICKQYGVAVCDLHKEWLMYIEEGIDITDAFLANYLNHPDRNYHRYMATRLVERLMGK